jgi:hypothetical protein
MESGIASTRGRRNPVARTTARTEEMPDPFARASDAPASTAAHSVQASARLPAGFINP